MSKFEDLKLNESMNLDDDYHFKCKVRKVHCGHIYTYYYMDTAIGGVGVSVHSVFIPF